MSENEELTEEGLGKWLDRVFVYVPEHLFDMKPLDQLRKIVKEHFRKRCLTIDLDNLCKDRKTCNYLKKTGIEVVEHLVDKKTVTRGWILILWAEIFDILQNATLEENEDAKILSHIESKLTEIGVEVVKKDG